MNEWIVTLTYATHHIIADDYSISGGMYLFWIGKIVVRSFPEADVVSVTLKGRAATEKQR